MQLITDYTDRHPDLKNKFISYTVVIACRYIPSSLADAFFAEIKEEFDYLIKEQE
jgi:hypothetical protein